MVRVRWNALAGALLAAALVAGHALGQDLALAESLFQEGRRLLDAGKASEACGKFAESLRIDRSSGTLLNLAECHVVMGKPATAWAEFTAAGPLARQQGNVKRAEVAARRAAEIEKTLSYLTITVAAPTPGLTVRRGDQIIQESALSVRVPTDPGTYAVQASAKGFAPWSREVTLKPGGDEQTVTIPALTARADDAPPASSAASSASSAPAAPPTAPPTTPAPPRRPTAAYVALGAGALFLGAGAFFGLRARSTYQDAEGRCPSHTDCDPSIKTDRDRASQQAMLANVGVGLGAVGIGVGTVLLLTAPKGRSEARRVRVAPVASPSTAGLFVDGAF
ncbi:MAG: hypothetical protein IT374_24950 [Polyangiaceae bacterium]|nr:hypothetical protein [Polyangiaceae bacterium]